MQSRHRATITPLLLTTVLGLGCDTNEASDINDELRAQPANSCTSTKGDIGKECHGPNCVVQLDHEITCAGDERAEFLQLALNANRIWADFRANVTFRQAFRVQGQGLVWVDPLPGAGFAGQAVDGTMYRYFDFAAYLVDPVYLRSTNSGWEEVAVAGLPNNYFADHGFRIRPDGVGGLHAEYETGDWDSGQRRLATQQPDDSWTWTTLHASKPNSQAYLGKDAWDRSFALVHTYDWEDAPRILLNFQNRDDFPVGEPGDDLGRIANPPRPVSGGDVPIATLRQMEDSLALLSIVDENDWTENEIVGTEPVSGSCPATYFANEPICPPCHADVAGVEQDAYQLVRTSGGQLWGAWFEIDASVDFEYVPEPSGQRWRCRAPATIDADVTGTLHLAELAADGTIGRHVEYEFEDAGFLRSGDGSRRDLAIAAYGDEVAVLFPSHHASGDGLRMRLMVFDTSNIQ